MVREEKSTPIHLKTGVNILSFKAIKNSADATFTGDSDIMISYVKDIEYEPYREPQTVTLSLNQPLRGIGEYKDEVTKDGIIRRIKQIMLNGSEYWVLNNHQNNVKTNRFYLWLGDPYVYYNKKLCICNKLFFSKNNEDIEGILTYGQSLFIKLPKEQIPDVDTLKKYLSENPMTVHYVIAKPIIEPLAEESKKALESLHTNEGTTVIAVDGGEVEAGIEVEYAVKE